jgi:hypothetical protein
MTQGGAPARIRSSRPRAALACAAALLALGVGSAQASAATRATAPPRAHTASRPAIGISDNQATLFADPRFRWLGVRYARIVVPWNVARRPRELAWDAAWLQAARAAGVRPLVAFYADPSHPRLLPSVPAYGSAVRAFMKLFPWVTDYSPWNEENHPGQPTGSNPRRAAEYFNLLAARCPTCSITAADVLDIPNMPEWVSRFLRYAHRPRLWGLHSYVDVGLNTHRRAKQLLRMVRGQVWITEGGGVVWRWERPYGSRRATYVQHSEAHAATLAGRLLTLARSSPRVTRVYYYQWRVSHTLAWARAHRTISWDSGLLRPDCSARPALGLIARAVGRNPGRMPRARRDRTANCV